MQVVAGEGENTNITVAMLLEIHQHEEGREEMARWMALRVTAPKRLCDDVRQAVARTHLYPLA